jgi:lipocalin
LWVLSRTPQLEEVNHQHLVARAHAQGFEVTGLGRTP